MQGMHNLGLSRLSTKTSAMTDFLLVFEKPSKTDMRFCLTNRIEETKTGIAKTIKLYRKRRRIEEVFRFSKQEFRTEKYLVRNMNSVNTLMTMLTACVNLFCPSISDSSFKGFFLPRSLLFSLLNLISIAPHLPSSKCMMASTSKSFLSR